MSLHLSLNLYLQWELSHLEQCIVIGGKIDKGHMAATLKGSLSVPISMNFWKSSKRGAGSFPIQTNFVAKFWALENPIWGGQRQFGTFPKIHRYWYRQASLNIAKKRHNWIVCAKKIPHNLRCQIGSKSVWWKNYHYNSKSRWLRFGPEVLIADS